MNPATNKITVIGNKEQLMKYWEYRCKTCKQLRLHCFEEKPVECGNCKSTELVIGKPGELPTEGI